METSSAISDSSRLKIAHWLVLKRPTDRFEDSRAVVKSIAFRSGDHASAEKLIANGPLRAFSDRALGRVRSDRIFGYMEHARSTVSEKTQAGLLIASFSRWICEAMLCLAPPFLPTR